MEGGGTVETVGETVRSSSSMYGEIRRRTCSAANSASMFAKDKSWKTLTLAVKDVKDTQVGTGTKAGAAVADRGATWGASGTGEGTAVAERWIG